MSSTVLAAAPWPGHGPRVTAVRTFLTGPQGSPYCIVRVETDQPGLYGLGCASDPQRTQAVRTVLDDYLGPLLIGRPCTDVVDNWTLLTNSGYWRGGSIANNALAAIDVALWDIKAKDAGLPLYDLFGGRVRRAAAVYGHADGRDTDEIVESVGRYVERGYRHVRVQVAVPGADTYAAGSRPKTVDDQRDGVWNAEAYLRVVPEMLHAVRAAVGPGVRLLHDAHERLTVAQARRLMAAIEGADLFFLEDALAPEDAHHLGELRAAGSTPLALGELFDDVRHFRPLLADRLIDFARIRIPTLGGLTPVRNLVGACEFWGVRLALHGPGDVSPVGHAANLAIDVSAPSFGIQEAAPFTEATLEVFPGTVVPEHGELTPTEVPGLGVDFDERAAARYPAQPPLLHDRWALLRNIDGSVQRP